MQFTKYCSFKEDQIKKRYDCKFDTACWPEPSKIVKIWLLVFKPSTRLGGMLRSILKIPIHIILPLTVGPCLNIFFFFGILFSWYLKTRISHNDSCRIYTHRPNCLYSFKFYSIYYLLFNNKFILIKIICYCSSLPNTSVVSRAKF